MLEAELFHYSQPESCGHQEQLLREALKLCPHNFTALLRLAAILHEQGNTNEVARLLAQAERLAGPQRADEIRRHLSGE